MQKIFLATFLLLLNFFSHGQKTYHVSKLQSGTYNASSQKWVWNDEEITDITIKINGNVFSISNKSNSVITTRDIILENNNGVEKKTIWNASDQTGKECNLIWATTLASGKESISLYYLHITVIYKLD